MVGAKRGVPEGDEDASPEGSKKAQKVGAWLAAYRYMKRQFSELSEGG